MPPRMTRSHTSDSEEHARRSVALTLYQKHQEDLFDA